MLSVQTVTGTQRCQGSGEVSSEGGEKLISSANKQALCLKQTNTGLSLLSLMVLQWTAPQEQ